MSHTFNVRPYIGDRNLIIDGRMIPYPLVTARDYLLAKKYRTDEDVDDFIRNNDEQYTLLNAIIAMKQSIVLLEHTIYTFDSLEHSLEKHKDEMVAKYNAEYTDEPFDEDFYNGYANSMTVVHEHLRDIDLSDMELPMLTIYNNPMDFPGQLVVRILNITAGDVQMTNAVIVRDSIDDCHKEIAEIGFRTKILRNTNDDPCIVESWMR